MESLYQQILRNKQAGKKQFAVLVDPDFYEEEEICDLAVKATESHVDFLFTGGSLLLGNHLSQTVDLLKQHSGLPVVLFPGNTMQICKQADGILFLSVVSGRNPEMLIGRHVLAAPLLLESGLEVIPVAYLLIEGGTSTSVVYMSGTMPIPSSKPAIALATAQAGELLGMKLIYLEAGSGAVHPVPADMIRMVRNGTSLPLLVGGGIRTVDQAREILNAGADMIIIGNAIEKNRNFIGEISVMIHREFLKSL